MELLDDAALARRVHANVIETMALMGRHMVGSRVTRLPGLTALDTPVPLLLFNQLLVEDGDTPARDVERSIREGVASFRDQGKRFSLTLRAGFDDAWCPLAGELGLEPLDATPWMPGMALHPLPEPGSLPPPPGHEIRAVKDEHGLTDHAEVAAAGFGMPLEWVHAVITPGLLAAGAMTFYVGYQDGTPVTSGLGVVMGATVGVYNIATIESARGRGLGRAMTQRIVDDGACAGCEVAILQSSEMGLPVYVRLGFRTVAEYLAYVQPRE
jgi:GNAT superfamily N-acetyltransferase